MTRAEQHWKNSEGTALLLTLGYLAAITLFVGGFITSLHRTMDRHARNEWQQQCQGIAEGGLAKAVAELRRSAGAYRGEEATPLGDGVFSVEVSETGSAGQYRIVSIGELRDGDLTTMRRRLVAEVRLDSGGVVRALRWVEMDRP